MTSNEVKKNLYYQMRRRAADDGDEDFDGRDTAYGRLGISPTRLYKIEKGLAIPHRDEVMVMAKEYKAPELLIFYCKQVCPIGTCLMKESEANGRIDKP